MCGIYVLSDANNNNNNNNNAYEQIQKIDRKPRKIEPCIHCTTLKLNQIGYMYKEEEEEACYKLKRHTNSDNQTAEYLNTKYKEGQIVNIVKITINQTTKYEFNKSKGSKF